MPKENTIATQREVQMLPIPDRLIYAANRKELLQSYTHPDLLPQRPIQSSLKPHLMLLRLLDIDPVETQPLVTAAEHIAHHLRPSKLPTWRNPNDLPLWDRSFPDLFSFIDMLAAVGDITKTEETLASIPNPVEKKVAFVQAAQTTLTFFRDNLSPAQEQFILDALDYDATDYGLREPFELAWNMFSVHHDLGHATQEVALVDRMLNVANSFENSINDLSIVDHIHLGAALELLSNNATLTQQDAATILEKAGRYIQKDPQYYLNLLHENREDISLLLTTASFDLFGNIRTKLDYAFPTTTFDFSSADKLLGMFVYELIQASSPYVKILQLENGAFFGFADYVKENRHLFERNRKVEMLDTLLNVEFRGQHDLIETFETANTFALSREEIDHLSLTQRQQLHRIARRNRDLESVLKILDINEE